MTKEDKILMVKAVVMFSAGIAASAVVNNVLSISRPVNMGKVNNFVYGVGIWAISGLVAEAAAEYVGKTFDSIFKGGLPPMFKSLQPEE